MPKPLELLGRQFGRLEVLAQAPSKSGRCWICLCVCGSTIIVRAYNLLKRSGTVSCGCYRRSGLGRTHGHTVGGRRTITHSSWSHMIERCSNPNHHQFRDYGGRGISIHPAWLIFERFVSEVGERPSRNHSLDRFPNNNGNYEPGNVRWATRNQQAQNRRSAAPEIGQARTPRSGGETVSHIDWLRLCERYGKRCLSCGSQAPLTMDHVIPRCKGGPHRITNLQPLCRKCNRRKGTTIIDYRDREQATLGHRIE